MPGKTLTLEIDDYDARFILEALKDLSAKWLHINRTTTDEDVQADSGNDYMFLDGRRERIEQRAVEVFGSQITNFSREPIVQS